MEKLYFIDKDSHYLDSLRRILTDNPYIKFVSLMAIDLKGSVTDEKIPVQYVLDDIEAFFSKGVLTDGSSLSLDGIASLKDAQVEVIPDNDVKWFIDYNDNLTDEATKLPVGTLRIPSFLIHHNKEVCSRSVLKRARRNFKNELVSLLAKYEYLQDLGIDEISEIDDVVLTTATELEFWVKTVDSEVNQDKLSTSQSLKEHYWKRINGNIRTALEKTLMLMSLYGLNPEMGHKEVGGCYKMMEQLEIDFRYDDCLYSCDNEVFVRDLISDVFSSYGLDVSFKAKVLEGIAGNGKHTHLGVALRLKNGKMVNLFSQDNEFLSPIGYGALMGMLKNYEIINPFISSSSDALRRLKPGFEAPVCVVTSLGLSVNEPSRNRSMLIDIIRDISNKGATRFELRSPNPLSNTYLVVSACYQSMIDGIRYAIRSKKSAHQLEMELSKVYGEKSDYLEKNRVYRSEEDVFEHFSEEERSKLFGVSPKTVYENIKNLKKYPDKMALLLENGVFDEVLLNAYKEIVIKNWLIDLKHRVLVNYANEINVLKEKYNVSYEENLFIRIEKAIDKKDYQSVSELQVRIDSMMERIRQTYR